MASKSKFRLKKKTFSGEAAANVPGFSVVLSTMDLCIISKESVASNRHFYDSKWIYLAALKYIEINNKGFLASEFRQKQIMEVENRARGRWV